MQGRVNMQDEITQIEKFIENNKGFFKEKEASTYGSLRKQHNRSHSEAECEECKDYLTSLKQLECIIRDRSNNKELSKIYQNYNKMRKRSKEYSNKINKIKKENKYNDSKMQKLSNTYKEQKGASIIFAILAVVLVALVGYVIIFQLTCPSCILDNAVVKQNVTALVNSAI